MTYLLVVLAVVARFLPHPPNFVPVNAALLFGGVHLERRYALWFPVVLIAVSDILLTTQVYQMRVGWTQLVVWVAYGAVVLIGRWLKGRVSVGNVLGAAFAGSSTFFLVSNFAVWLGWRMYPPTWEGLLACYTAALPFFRNSLAGDLLFTALFFAVYELYRRKMGETRVANPVAHTG